MAWDLKFADPAVVDQARAAGVRPASGMADLCVQQPGLVISAVTASNALPVAQEAALKFKETGGLHAEAFSAAEVRHGPMALVGAGFPVLAFLPADETRGSVEETLHTFRAAGASVWTVGGDGPGALPTVDADPALLPIAQIQALYRLVEDVAKRRGHDPDAPPMLRKVTETL